MQFQRGKRQISKSICDRIVGGIRYTSLSEQLLMDPELTLEKAKIVVQQREAVREQQVALQGERLEALHLVEIVGYKSMLNNQKRYEKSRQAHTPQQKRYTRCGEDRLPRDA